MVTQPSTIQQPAPAAAYDRRAAVRRGVRAGLVAMAATIAWLMFCGEVSAAPTSLPGIQSSSWTAVTAVTALVFGADAVHGSFHVGSIAFGLAALLVLGAAFGALGALWVAETVGPAAGPLGAVAAALVFAAVLQVLLINLLANALQEPDVLYDAIPPWGWTAATATYGSVLGLRLARLGRRAAERAA